MADVKQSVYPVLLAGGTGTRLWPVSRALYPKQLVKFIGNDSLVQSTVKRLAPVLDLQNVRVVCGQQHLHERRSDRRRRRVVGRHGWRTAGPRHRLARQGLDAGIGNAGGAPQCTLHDAGNEDGTDYLVMEHVEGKPLKGPMPVEEALRLLRRRLPCCRLRWR